MLQPMVLQSTAEWGGAFIQAAELAFSQFQEEEDAHLKKSSHDKAHTSRST
jgi:hypothetical protein